MSALATMPAKPKRKPARHEMAPDEPIEVREKKMRRQYDLSVMEAEQPQLVSLVAWLVTIPGMSYQAIEERAGMAWETVAAIAAKGYDVSAWRSKAADKVALVLEAATPGLLKRAAEGELNAFEFKQLVDAWGQLSATATVRTEHTININISQAESELMRMIDAKAHVIPPLLYDTGIGSSSQILHALPASTDQPVVPDGIRESEESTPNSDDHV